MAVHSNYVTINGLTLDIAGFCVVRDLSPLLTAGDLRGGDFTAQGVDGDTYRAKSLGAHRLLLPLLIFGDNDKTGSAHTYTWVGLRDNVEEIRSTCVDGTKSALKTLTLTFQDASTRSGSVYCPRLDVSLHNGYRASVLSGVLEVVIPAGELT